MASDIWEIILTAAFYHNSCGKATMYVPWSMGGVSFVLDFHASV